MNIHRELARIEELYEGAETPGDRLTCAMRAMYDWVWRGNDWDGTQEEWETARQCIDRLYLHRTLHVDLY